MLHLHKKGYFCEKYENMRDNTPYLRRMVLSLLLLLAVTAASAARIGDVNGDGQRTVGDVMQTVTYIMSPSDVDESFDTNAADVNRDGSVSVVDVMLLVGIIMGQEEEPDDPDNPILDIDDRTGADPADGL